MNPVSLVTIKELLPLWKDEEAANSIQLCHLEEYGFDLVVMKGLYQVGDKAIYIQPDFCLPEGVELFSEYLAPGGNPNKSRLGKGNRIRAIKFNFHRGDNDPVFSTGILLPYHEVVAELLHKGVAGELTEELLNEHLGVYKYEAPETGKSGQAKGDLPLGMYATDETNFENVVRKMQFPIELMGTVKYDGSSITIYYRGPEDKGICSRSMEKKLIQTMTTGYITPDGNKLRKHFDRETMQRGWFNEATNEFFTEVPEGYTPVEEVVEDSWVKLGMPVLEKLEAYCVANNRQLALRGEIYGQGLKGSGNKNNPHSKLKQGVALFGLDDYSDHRTVKLPMTDFFGLCYALDIPTVEPLFHRIFISEEQLREECANVFKSRMIEGIVLRTDDCKFSAKFMNPTYDAQK